MRKGKNSLKRKIQNLAKEYDIQQIKEVVDDIHSKYVRDSSYYEQVKDFIFKVCYNYLKKHDNNIPLDRVLYYLEKFKKIDLSNPYLKAHYIKLVKKIRKKAYDKIRYEKILASKKEQEFLNKILEYNREGFLTKTACDLTCEFFFSYTIAGFKDTQKDASFSIALIDVFSIGASIYQNKALHVNLLVKHFQDEYIEDREFIDLMNSLKDLRLSVF